MQETVACPGSGALAYGAFTLASGIDGIEVRARSQTSATEFVKLTVIGEVCKGATDKPACLAKVTETKSNTGWSHSTSMEGPSPPHYGVGTRGDEVFLVATQAAFAKAVAPLESAQEAVALVQVVYDDSVVCNDANVSSNATSYVVKTLSSSCGSKGETLFTVSREGDVQRGSYREITSPDSNCAEGRRPSGLVMAPEPWLRSLSAHFAEIAFMEAAAVLAFDELQGHLRAFGAPPDLRLRVRKARADEVRHAAATTRLARRFGGVPKTPVCVESGALPTLLGFAIENAREGCIREAYGALVAAYQAKHAQDPDVAAVFRTIRDEEIEHAELSWAIADWVHTKLTPRERQQVQRARIDMIEELRVAVLAQPSDDVRIVAGMPDARTASMLLDQLQPVLLAAGA